MMVGGLFRGSMIEIEDLLERSYVQSAHNAVTDTLLEAYLLACLEASAGGPPW